VLTDTPNVLEHGTTKSGRWLRARRTRLALWIAVIEGILVAVLHDFTRWTVVLIAIPLILLYFVSIFSCRWVERQRAKREAEEEAELAKDDPAGE